MEQGQQLSLFEEETKVVPIAHATVYSCLVVDCPRCGTEVQELGSDQMDLTGWDFEETGTIECTNPECNKEFEYSLLETD